MHLIHGETTASIAARVYADLESWILVGVVRAPACSHFFYHVVFHALGFVVSVNEFWETRQSGTATLAVDGSYCGVWRFSSSESDFLHKPVLQFRKRIHRSQRLK